MIQELKNVYHLGRAIGANALYGFPARSLTVIAVTGTDGKTTTASLIYHVLKQNGYKVGLLTTVGAYINGKEIDTGLHVTTPDSLQLQKLLKLAKRNGTEYFVLEVTSHGIDQNRIWGIPIAIGVLTNISHEHLDYHKTYKRYVSVKTKLLERSSMCVINADDQSFRSVYPRLKKLNKKTVLYGMKRSADVNPENTSCTSPLTGKFNTYNSLAAVAVARQLGMKENEICDAVATFQPPKGRQNVVYDKDFRVIVDFAHTPHAIDELLQSLRKNVHGRLIHVFGSAGQRDAYKRPEMGRASSAYSDVIVLTAEDPRSEKVERINDEIKKGISNFQFSDHSEFFKIEPPFEKRKKLLFEIPDRNEAIKFAISLAQRGDTVVITGKGHEQSMNYGKGEVPWDEFDAVAKALELKKSA